MRKRITLGPFLRIRRYRQAWRFKDKMTFQLYKAASSSQAAEVKNPLH